MTGYRDSGMVGMIVRGERREASWRMYHGESIAVGNVHC